MDAWWDEAPKVEILINHEATDDVRFTLSRLVAAEGKGWQRLVFAPGSWRARHGACLGASGVEPAEPALKRFSGKWASLIWSKGRMCRC